MGTDGLAESAVIVGRLADQHEKSRGTSGDRRKIFGESRARDHKYQLLRSGKFDSYIPVCFAFK